MKRHLFTLSLTMTPGINMSVELFDWRTQTLKAFLNGGRSSSHEKICKPVAIQLTVHLVMVVVKVVMKMLAMKNTNWTIRKNLNMVKSDLNHLNEMLSMANTLKVIRLTSQFKANHKYCSYAQNRSF